MFSTTTILVIILLAYFICKPFARKVKPTPLPPGPSPWPIVGCLPQLLSAPNKYKWIFKIMNDFRTEIACIRIGNVHVISVTCSKFAMEFLKHQDALFASRPTSMAAALISYNYKGIVLSPNGMQWKKMRKILTSELFSPAMHKKLHDKRIEEADNLVNFVYNQPGGIVNLRKTTLHYSTNIIKRLIFNKRYFGIAKLDKGPSPADEEYVDGILRSLMYIFSFGISDYFSWMTGLDLDGKEKHALDANKILRKYHDPVIDERIRKWNCGSTVMSNDNFDDDMLDIMINLKDAKGKPLLSIDEIKALINELVIGATDNSSNVVEWALAEMLNQPHIIEKVMQELDQFVGKDRLIQECDIPKLNYIKACLMEAFRLHPVQPFIPPHFATKDVIVGGYLIPKGSHILISRYGVGRNPNIWDDPLTFNPERHVSNGTTFHSILTDPTLKFITFGIERRSCVAANLGTTMRIMLMARLLQAFDWSLPPGLTKVDLDENENDLFLATPLTACAKTRLSRHLYDFDNK